MSDPFTMSEQPTLPASPSAISSLALLGGQKPSDLPAGQQLDLFGQPLAPANPSARPAKAKAKKTPATSGRFCPPSSASVSLTASLGNRLVERQDTNGSMEYALTWKRQSTPSGLRIFRLAARARPTSAPACSGYPSPTAEGYEPADLERLQARREELLAKGINGNGFGLTLQQAIPLWLAGYPSPRASDGTRTVWNPSPGGGNVQLDRMVGTWLSGWASPTGQDAHNASGPSQQERNSLPLNAEVLLAGWGTPAVSDNRDVRYSYGNRNTEGKPYSVNLRLAGEVQLASGATSSSCPAGTAKSDGRRLNPHFSLWLMGFLAEWGCSGAVAMRSLRRQQHGSSRRYSKSKGRSNGK